MTENHKYLRLVAEFEVEAVDPTAARAYTMDWMQTEQGELSLVPEESDDAAIRWAVQMAVFNALDERGQEGGFKAKGGTMHLRPVLDGRHPEHSFPEMAAKNDDRKFSDE